MPYNPEYYIRPRQVPPLPFRDAYTVYRGRPGPDFKDIPSPWDKLDRTAKRNIREYFYRKHGVRLDDKTARWMFQGNQFPKPPGSVPFPSDTSPVRPPPGPLHQPPATPPGRDALIGRYGRFTPRPEANSIIGTAGRGGAVSVLYLIAREWIGELADYRIWQEENRAKPETPVQRFAVRWSRNNALAIQEISEALEIMAGGPGTSTYEHFAVGMLQLLYTSFAPPGSLQRTPFDEGYAPFPLQQGFDYAMSPGAGYQDYGPPSPFPQDPTIQIPPLEEIIEALFNNQLIDSLDRLGRRTVGRLNIQLPDVPELHFNLPDAPEEIGRTGRPTPEEKVEIRPLFSGDVHLPDVLPHGSSAGGTARQLLNQGSDLIGLIDQHFFGPIGRAIDPPTPLRTIPGINAPYGPADQPWAPALDFLPTPQAGRGAGLASRVQPIDHEPWDPYLLIGTWQIIPQYEQLKKEFPFIDPLTIPDLTEHGDDLRYYLFPDRNLYSDSTPYESLYPDVPYPPWRDYLFPPWFYPDEGIQPWRHSPNYHPFYNPTQPASERPAGRGPGQASLPPPTYNVPPLFPEIYGPPPPGQTDPRHNPLYDPKYNRDTWHFEDYYQHGIRPPFLHPEIDTLPGIIEPYPNWHFTHPYESLPEGGVRQFNFPTTFPNLELGDTQIPGINTPYPLPPPKPIQTRDRLRRLFPDGGVPLADWYSQWLLEYLRHPNESDPFKSTDIFDFERLVDKLEDNLPTPKLGAYRTRIALWREQQNLPQIPGINVHAGDPTSGLYNLPDVYHDRFQPGPDWLDQPYKPYPDYTDEDFLYESTPEDDPDAPFNYDDYQDRNRFYFSFPYWIYPDWYPEWTRGRYFRRTFGET